MNAAFNSFPCSSQVGLHPAVPILGGAKKQQLLRRGLQRDGAQQPAQAHGSVLHAGETRLCARNECLCTWIWLSLPLPCFVSRVSMLLALSVHAALAAALKSVLIG